MATWLTVFGGRPLMDCVALKLFDTEELIVEVCTHGIIKPMERIT